MVHPQSNVAVSSVGITFAMLWILYVQIYLLGKILNCLFESLHLSINYPDVWVGNCIRRVVSQSLFKVLDWFIVFSHVFIATSSVMVKNWIFPIKLDCFTELNARVLVILKLVVNYAECVVNRWELWVLFKELLETIKSFLIIRFSFVVQSQIIQTIHIFGFKFYCCQVIFFFLLLHA